MSPPDPATADGADVLVLASWFPAVDESSRGRFVADQVQALAASGRVRPAVVSFDSIGLTGAPEARRRQAVAVSRLSGAAIRRDPRRFSPAGVNAPPGVPIARLAIAGSGAAVPSAFPMTQREHVLAALEPSVRGVRIVHAHTGFPDGASAVGFAARLGVPLVLTEHASFVASILADRDRGAAYRRAAAAAARVIAVSRMLADELGSAIPGLAGKLVVIPNAVDVDAFAPQPLAARHPDELVYIGYRIESKGLSLLLRSFAAVRRSRPAATLRLIGRSQDEETERQWHDLARSLGVLDAVRFDPPGLRPAVAEALGRASILVHASPRETFGMTAVEALASGTPVVARDSGGVTETVGADGRLGEIVGDADPEAFAAAIVRTLERRATFDPGELRASVVERYGAASVASRLASLYDELSEPIRSGAPRSGSPTPTTDPGPDVPGPVLVVGFVTHQALRILRTMPPATRARIDLLCATGEGADELPDDLHARTVIDIDGPFEAAMGPAGKRPRATTVRARIQRLVQDPIGIVRRRLVRARRDRYRAAAARAALEQHLAGRADRDRIDIVGVTGLDYEAIDGVPAAAARLVPGGLRWLADQLGERSSEPSTAWIDDLDEEPTEEPTEALP